MLKTTSESKGGRGRGATRTSAEEQEGSHLVNQRRPPHVRVHPSAQAALAPSAQRLLDASRRLLEKSGYASLTLEAIGREAGERKSLVHYHFGGKPGLLVALADQLFYETLWDMRARVGALPDGDDRLDALADDLKEMLINSTSYRLYYELLPHLIADPRVRGQLADLYAGYRDLVSHAIDPAGALDDSARLSAFVSLTIGMVDGVAIQLLCDPTSVDAHETMRVWLVSLRTVLTESTTGR